MPSNSCLRWQTRSSSAHWQRASGSQAHLRFFPPFTSLWLSSFPGGDEWESGGAISHVFAQRFAGDEHPPGMLSPSLSFCCARRSTPNPNKTVCIRIWSRYNILLPANFDSVCKSYRVRPWSSGISGFKVLFFVTWQKVPLTPRVV